MENNTQKEFNVSWGYEVRKGETQIWRKVLYGNIMNGLFSERVTEENRGALKKM